MYFFLSDYFSNVLPVRTVGQMLEWNFGAGEPLEILQLSPRETPHTCTLTQWLDNLLRWGNCGTRKQVFPFLSRTLSRCLTVVSQVWRGLLVFPSLEGEIYSTIENLFGLVFSDKDAQKAQFR